MCRRGARRRGLAESGRTLPSIGRDETPSPGPLASTPSATLTRPRPPDVLGIPDARTCSAGGGCHMWGTRTNVSSTSTKDFHEENPCIDRGREEGQHGAGKDPVQPAPGAGKQAAASSHEGKCGE
jgi:hypothetical protein